MTRFFKWGTLEVFRVILKRVAPDVSSLPPLGRLTKQKNRFGVTLGKKLSCAQSSATTLLYVCCYVQRRSLVLGTLVTALKWCTDGRMQQNVIGKWAGIRRLGRRRKIIIAPTCEFIHGNYLNFAAALLIKKVWWWGGSSSKKKPNIQDFLQMVFLRTI